ncbi:BQ2448_6189 [Microbotryum intermedium]|uniref:BQ2448_6189 protein n=1 Tax=Microbotryum intermedium TaxID=269621 RepID=A0A238FLV2_9BASI|nr:BQ2448_6189 [Microbotryum intermedium]
MSLSNTSLSNLPLLNESHIEQADITLTSLTRAAAALKEGKLPTSQQFATLVQKVLKSNLLQPELGARLTGKVGGGKLSVRGRELVESERAVLEGLVRIVLEKNSDDKIQRFLWVASQADFEVDADADLPDVPVPSDHEIGEATRALKQLFTLLLTSSQLRRIVGDVVNLFRDMFADAADQAAEASIRATKASKQAAKTMRAGEEEKAEGKVNVSINGDVSSKQLKKKVLRGAEDAKDDALASISKSGRQLKSYVDEKLPTDVKDAFIERFKAVVDEIQSNPEFEESINTIVGLIRKYAARSKEALKETASSVDAKVETNDKADSAASLFREIVESFTGDLSPVFQTADKVARDLENDSRIKSLLEDAESLLDRAINDPGYITSSRAQRRAESLYDQAQELVNSNAAWKKDADEFVAEASKCLHRAANDKALVQLGDRFERLGKAFTKFTQTGFTLTDGGAMWADLTQVFLPRILGALEEIPLPRVEFTSEDVDLVIDNVRFTSASFVPDATHFRNHNEISVKKGCESKCFWILCEIMTSVSDPPVSVFADAAYASEFSTSTTLSISGLRLQAKDISYYLHKKAGWLTVEDYGMLDIKIGTEGEDDGLDVTLTVKNAEESDRESFFKLTRVEVALTGFSISIHDSQHPIRNFFARPALRGCIEKQFVSTLEEQIGAMFQQADRAVYDLNRKAAGARLASPDPLTFLRAVFTPTGPSLISSITSTGITKVGAKGEYILAIGVEEELLPGKRTGLGHKGRDVVSKKRAAESLMEEGVSQYEQVRNTVEEVGEAIGEEAERIQKEARDQARKERRDSGWKSQAFDV